MGYGDAMDFGGNEHEDESRADPHSDDDLDYPGSALPHPLDRLWLHPSELSPLAAATVTRPRPMWTTTLVAGAAGAILTVAVLGAIGAIGRSSDHPSEAGVVPTSTPIATAKAVAVAVAQSVVAVSAHDRDRTRRGSGVCVRKTGEILTSDRLVGNATKIDVTTADGAVHRAKILGRDPTTDLVLLGFDQVTPKASAATTKSTVPASFASRVPHAGDVAWVVGAPSPGDSEPWMSTGLVASTDSLVAFASGPTTSGLLETAAASSSASSGGALVDRNGAVTGIVLAPVGSNRMTYAVPISTAMAIANSLRSRGYATHGALGITGINASAGPTVTKVLAGGPAALAGVRVGDIVEAVDRHEVYSMDDVMAVVRHNLPGKIVEVELQRGSDTVKIKAKLTGMVVP